MIEWIKNSFQKTIQTENAKNKISFSKFIFRSRRRRIERKIEDEDRKIEDEERKIEDEKLNSQDEMDGRTHDGAANEVYGVYGGIERWCVLTSNEIYFLLNSQIKYLRIFDVERREDSNGFVDAYS